MTALSPGEIGWSVIRCIVIDDMGVEEFAEVVCGWELRGIWGWFGTNTQVADVESSVC